MRAAAASDSSVTVGKVAVNAVMAGCEPRHFRIVVAAVEANGVPVEYVLFPDEGHGFRRRDNRITASEAYVDFLDEYLRGETSAD